MLKIKDVSHSDRCENNFFKKKTFEKNKRMKISVRHSSFSLFHLFLYIYSRDMTRDIVELIEKNKMMTMMMMTVRLEFI